MQSALRTVIITGCNKGIGYAIIERLLSEPTAYDIVMTARNPQLGEESFKKLKDKYKSATSGLTFQQLDINDPGSVDNFINWMKHEKNSKFDVLINNAGFGYLRETPEERMRTLKTNFLDTVEFTEKMLPYLSSDGKIIMVSSENGLLSWQGKKIHKILDNPSNTREMLMELYNELVERTKKGTHEELGWSDASYDASKALLNAYTRWVLMPMMKGDQQCYCLDPGWCRTDMGGKGAPLAVERGADTPVYLMNLSYKHDDKYNGKFFMRSKVHEF